MLVYIALSAAFFILLIEKVGIREKVQAKAPKLISELFSCDFCLSWWTCLIVATMISIITKDWQTIILAVPATPLTRFIL